MPSSAMPSFAALALPLLALSPLIAAQTYLGCTTTATLNEGDSDPTVSGSLDDCTFTCEKSGTSYSYYSVDEGMCYCSSATPPAGIFTTANGDESCSDEDYTVYDYVTSFEFQGCYSNMVTDNAPADTDTLDACFAACASEGSVMYEPYCNFDSDEWEFGCRCNTAMAIEITGGGNEVTCGQNTWFTFSHSAEATASGLARRALRERLTAAKKAKKSLCPGGMTACKVAEYNAYECIDTTSELESCGGCLFGEYEGTSNSTAVGTDCTSLQAIARGAVSCVNSQCQAFACTEGYSLVVGECVAA